MPLDAARDLFEQFKQRGYERVNEALQNDEEEDQYLDFKEHPRTQTRSDNWRKIFGKAASGFANSEGGVLVWGVEAKDFKPIALKPIPEVNRFYRELLSQNMHALAPVLDGIEHHEV